MVDQLVASRGQMFFGAYFSTFTVSEQRTASAAITVFRLTRVYASSLGIY